MAKIVVTGGMGYIGSHTVVELQLKGHEVCIIDDLSNSSVDVLDGIEGITGIRPEFEALDLKDRTAVDAFFDRHDGITGIIHFAAFKAVGESVAEPLRYYDNNLSSLIHLLNAMRRTGVEAFIFSSSCTVYGQAESLPITEDAPVQPAESPYGNTKQIGEEILIDSCKAFQALKVISLRYFNPIGAHASALIGELPLGIPQNLVPFITQTAIGLREQLAVFGNDYPTEDGTCIRDYIHVVDLAKAHVQALERLLEGRQTDNFEVFNLGTGRGNSVLEVIQAFEKVSGRALNYRIADRRPGDVVAAYADTTKAERVLGWKAELSLEEALASAWKWEQYIRNKT